MRERKAGWKPALRSAEFHSALRIAIQATPLNSEQGMPIERLRIIVYPSLRALAPTPSCLRKPLPFSYRRALSCRIVQGVISLQTHNSKLIYLLSPLHYRLRLNF